MRSHARTSYDTAASAARRPRSSRRREARASLQPTLRGRVLDAATGEPVAGASLALVPATRCRPGGACVSETDPSGSFELARPAAPGVLLVRRDGYLPELAAVAPRRGDVFVRLARAGAVDGELTGADGEPLAGVRVLALSPSAMDVREGSTDAEGRFRIEGLRPGRYVVKPLDAAASPGVAPIVAEVRAGEVATASLRAPEGRLPPVALAVA